MKNEAQFQTQKVQQTGIMINSEIVIQSLTTNPSNPLAPTIQALQDIDPEWVKWLVNNNGSACLYCLNANWELSRAGKGLYLQCFCRVHHGYIENIEESPIICDGAFITAPASEV